ncbi:MAG: 4Fe-4S binding protein [Bacillota bacterium]|nr:4Fe-4S binding protein [Bacillota bacterium]
MLDMIKNVFKNLGSKPATRQYPFEKREPFKNTRGQVGGVDIDTCIFCGICSRKCPSNAITVNKNEKSWEINRYKCVVCGVCSEVCPKKCLHMQEDYRTAATKMDNFKLVQQPKAEEPVKEENSQQ